MRATDSEKGVIPAKAGIQVDLVFPAKNQDGFPLSR
jgi:hypothetical protein